MPGWWVNDSVWLYQSMCPTVIDCLPQYLAPCLLCHYHCLKKVNLIHITIPCFIMINGVLIEILLIKCLECLDDTSIAWLDKYHHTWHKVFQGDVFWLIFNSVTQEVVHEQQDVAIFHVHLDIKFDNPSVPKSIMWWAGDYAMTYYWYRADVIHTVSLFW